MSLREIFERQLENQIKAYGADPRKLTGKAATEFVHYNTLALGSELFELLDEHGWKPWSKNFTEPPKSQEAVAGEAADLLCFLVNLMLVNNVTSDDLEAAYFEKAGRNAKRQQEGYDVSKPKWKCRECGRALDDPGVKCTTIRCLA